MKKGILLSVCTLTLGLAAGLLGCTHEEPVSGGTTDKTNPKAPTVIESKEITSFSSSFRLYDIWSVEHELIEYRFEIAPDENNVLMASEEESGIRFPADDALLSSLQQVIDDQHLASRNGVYRVTAGLPPEFQQCTFKTGYASGETLSFTVNNELESAWGRAVKDVFADWFALQGDDSLAVPKEAKQVTELKFKLILDGYSYRFQPYKVKDLDAINGQTLLLLGSASKSEDGSQLYGGTIPYPSDYFDRISEILLRYTNVLNASNATYTSETIDPKIKSLELYITYENGRRLNIRTDGPRRIEALRPVLNELIEYHQSLFDSVQTN